MPDLGIGEAIALASVAEVGADAAVTAGVADGLAAAGAGALGAGAEGAGIAAGVGAGVAGGAEAGLGAGALGAGLSDAAIVGGVADGLSAAGGGVLGAGAEGAGALGGAGSSFGAGIPGIATGAPSLGATAPAGTSALGAGAVGDVGGAAGGFTLPSAAGTPGASAIGTGATEGSVSGFSSAGGIGGGSLEAPAASASDFGFLGPQSTAELNGANPAGFASGNLGQAASPFADASTVTGPGATGTAGGAPSVAPSSIENFVNTPGFGTAGKALGANANLLVPGALLGIESLMQPSMPDPSKISRTQGGTADKLTAQGGQLLDGLNTGKLPAGAQASIDQASASAKAHIRSQYAGMGLAGSPMEQQALNQVDSQAAQQKFDMITKLVNTGVQETQLGNQIYDELLKSTLAEDDALSKSISNFAAASAGGGRPLIAVG